MVKALIATSVILFVLHLAWAEDPLKEAAKNPSSGVTLEQAHDLHMLLFKHLPRDARLTMKGFPDSRPRMGLEPSPAEKSDVGTWTVSTIPEVDDKGVAQGLAENLVFVKVLTDEAKGAYRWKGLFVTFETTDHERSRALSRKLIDALSEPRN